MSRLPQVLICDDDSTFHLAVKHTLKGKFECKSAYNGDEAIAVMKNHPIDVLLLDIQMRTPDEGLRFIPVFRETDPDLAIVMISGMTDFQTVREAMRLGATDYVPKDFNPDELIHSINRVIERRSLIQRKEQQNLEAVLTQKQHVLIGCSKAIQDLRKTIDKMRQSTANVVILGETGTGKEVVARQLRRTLPDGSLAPFMAIDSSTIQSSTAESILFGHEKGAFTGADKTTKGIFEEANNGIVYFDEIANMPLEIQAKLLRVLQEKEVTRLGSARTIQLDFRVVCATNKDLDGMVRSGQFKDDLLQRLNVLPIQVPPLRERREDVPVLVEHFTRRHAGESTQLAFTKDAIDVLSNYSWPGNVRELGNVIAYVLAMTDSSEIDVADLPPKIRDAARTAHEGRAKSEEGNSELSFYQQVMTFEKELLSREYARLSGNVSKLALSLGMDRSHLYTKLKEYGLHQTRSS